MVIAKLNPQNRNKKRNVYLKNKNFKNELVKLLSLKFPFIWFNFSTTSWNEDLLRQLKKHLIYNVYEEQTQQ